MEFHISRYRMTDALSFWNFEVLVPKHDHQVGYQSV